MERDRVFLGRPEACTGGHATVKRVKDVKQVGEAVQDPAGIEVRTSNMPPLELSSVREDGLKRQDVLERRRANDSRHNGDADHSDLPSSKPVRDPIDQIRSDPYPRAIVPLRTWRILFGCAIKCT